MQPTEMMTDAGERLTIHHVQLIVTERDEGNDTHISISLTAMHPETREPLEAFLEAVKQEDAA